MQEPLRVGVEAHVAAHECRVHVRVARGAAAVEPGELSIARCDHAVARLLGRHHAGRAQLVPGRPPDGQQHVDAIQQWTAQPAAVTQQVGLGAVAAALRVKPARARVRRGDEHEPRRVHGEVLSAHDRDAPVLQRLAQALERVARELAQLVEEQDAVVGEADLAGRGQRSAADQP